ncbi:LolA family protein [Streptomyces bohaiensis]|uniref:DUF2092 domain-containing protein n=1 Tax=Streptomyces bohaiensis TaxID=1431344 RepID=A0ABX1C437_9ACTN|nr:sigma-E factor regulatory protein RseB domain-containing protein [Streptomyces bohaiensis]NJQ13995.1 hypothetical protein [Streptomyces bohaiensis]
MAMNKKLRRTVVAGSVVCGVGLVGAGVYPALASDGGPDLPALSAEELLVKVAESETEQLSGTVRVDMGVEVPALGSFAEQFGGPAARLASLATGNSTLQVALDGEERQRLVVADGDEELSVIHNDGDVWMYDSADNIAYHADLAEHAEKSEAGTDGGQRGKAHEEFASLTPQQMAQEVLAGAGEHAEITVDGTARIAGQDAYQLLVVPHEPVEGAEFGTVESVRISVDAETGLPLAVTVAGPDRNLVDVAFTHIRYEQPAGGTFYFTPPNGAEVVDLNEENPFAGFGADGFAFGR